MSRVDNKVIITTGGTQGIGEAVALAAARGVKLAPHSPYFGPGALATLHLIATLPAETRFEYFYLWPEATLYGEVLSAKRGGLPIPSGAGLGADPDPDVLRRYRLD